MKIELYTRPTWTDCQAAKEFLSENNINYIEHDLGGNPDLEKELKEKTGTRIVPAFIIEEPKFLGLTKKRKVLIGFEANQSEIEKMLIGS